MREILAVTSTYVRTPVQTLRRGRGVPRQTDGGRGVVENARNSRGAFWQPAFFLAGNGMSTVAFEKEVF